MTYHELWRMSTTHLRLLIDYAFISFLPLTLTFNIHFERSVNHCGVKEGMAKNLYDCRSGITRGQMISMMHTAIKSR